MTDEHSTDHEQSVDVFELADGTLIMDTPASIDLLLEHGDWLAAYDLMRLRVCKEAVRKMRQAGCPFTAMDKHLAEKGQAETLDSRATAAIILTEVEDFVRSQDRPTPHALTAARSLRLLQWQRAALDRAATEAEARALVEMALFSSAIGFLAGTSGVGDATPSPLALMPAAMKQRSAALRGAAANRTKAAAWREPLTTFAKSWFDRRQPQPEHGLFGRVVQDFRQQNSGLAPFSEDLARRLVSDRFKEWWKLGT